MNYFSRFFALFLTLAGACAWAQEPVAPPAAVKAEDDRLPKQEMTGQILYQFLLAEIAAQQGQFGLSSSAYLELARSTRDPRIVRRAAEIAFHARQYDAALEASRLWVSLEPESAQARQMLSTLLLASGRIEELAGSLARDLAAEVPRVGDALIRMIRAFARYPDKMAIQRLFDQLTQPYLDLAEAHLVRAQTALGAGDAGRARGEIDQALQLRPGWELAALFKAELLPKGAAQLDFLKTWLAANPEAQDARLAYARGLVSEKRYEASRAEFRRLLAANPNNPDMLYAVGILSLQVNDAPEAEQQLKHFVEIGRGDLDPARFYLGQIADQAGRPDEALHWYGQVAAGEHALSAKVRAAQVLLRQGKLDEARERLAAARAEEPGDSRLVVAEAQLLRDAGRHADAFAFLAKMLEVQPDDPEILYETALTGEKLGYVDVMERHLRRLMVLKPDSAQAYNALGYSLADRNLRLDEAAQLIDKALSLTPDDPFILDSKGWLLFRQGKLAAALEILQKAYAQKPDAEIAAHIGEVLWALGRPDEALAVWREAAKAHPTNEELAATIKRFVP
ncbi:MAG: tetratricopeptide repeat protein [Sulfuritalea sp.]|jgi:tetratricopeptide (TPR) repeat protein|nr:tetratricopeptide repeat protein [Sulfuritalea sp.]